MYEASHSLSRSCSTLLAPSAFAQTFRADDPVWVDNDTAVDVKGIAKHKLNDQYDFLIHSSGSRETEQQQPAMNINTLGEVPDSSWFQNRHGKTRMSVEDLVRGPNTGSGPSMDGPWFVIGAKTEGITPGFRIRDARGRCVLHQVRSAAKPRNGDRGRSDFDEVLSRHGLQRPGKLPGILYAAAASGGPKGDDNGCDRPRTAS